MTCSVCYFWVLNNGCCHGLMRSSLPVLCGVIVWLWRRRSRGCGKVAGHSGELAPLRNAQTVVSMCVANCQAEHRLERSGHWGGCGGACHDGHGAWVCGAAAGPSQFCSVQHRGSTPFCLLHGAAQRVVGMCPAENPSQCPCAHVAVSAVTSWRSSAASPCCAF